MFCGCQFCKQEEYFQILCRVDEGALARVQERRVVGLPKACQFRLGIALPLNQV